jgi:hypothetical protein
VVSLTAFGLLVCSPSGAVITRRGFFCPVLAPSFPSQHDKTRSVVDRVEQQNNGSAYPEGASWPALACSRDCLGTPPSSLSCSPRTGTKGATTPKSTSGHGPIFRLRRVLISLGRFDEWLSVRDSSPAICGMTHYSVSANSA